MPTRYHRSTGTAYEVPTRTTTRKRTFGANWQNLNSDGVAVTPNRTTTRKRTNSNKKSNSTSAVEYRGSNPMTPFYTGTPRLTYNKAATKNNSAKSNGKDAKAILGEDVWNRLPKKEKERFSELAQKSTAQNVRIQANNWLKRNPRGNAGKGYTGSWNQSPSTYLNNAIWGQLTANERRSLEDLSSRGVSKDRIVDLTHSMLSRRYDMSNVSKAALTRGSRNSNNAAQKQAGRGGASAPRNNPPAAISDTTAVRTPAPAPAAAAPTVAPTRQPSAPVQKAPAAPTAPAAPAKLSNKVGNTPAKSSKPTTHTIAQGETLSGIAKRYGVDWRQLAKDNGIEDPNLIIAGRKLNINGSTKTPKKNKPRRSIRTTPTTDIRALTNPAFTPVIPSITPNISIPGVESGFRTPEEILSGI